MPGTNDARRWLVLAIVGAAFFMTILDVAIDNVALPSMGRDLEASSTSLQWVLTAYSLTFGGFLLLGSAEALGLALIAIACLGIAVGALFNFTITTVFRVALYRYATEGKVIGGFSEESMADAFAPRRGRRGHAAA